MKVLGIPDPLVFNLSPPLLLRRQFLPLRPPGSTMQLVKAQFSLRLNGREIQPSLWSATLHES